METQFDEELKILRKAIADTMNDKEFIAESTQRNGLPFDYVSEADAAKRAERVQFGHAVSTFYYPCAE